METLDSMFTKRQLPDPDETFRVEGDQANFFLTSIRIFYKLGPSANETIGMLVALSDG